MRVYSIGGILEDLSTLPRAPSTDFMGGLGNWFWFSYGNLNFYSVAASATPAASFPVLPGRPTPAGDMLGVVDFLGGFRLIDLSGAVPHETAYPSAVRNETAWVPISQDRWLMGNVDGLVYELWPNGAPKYFTYGRLRSVVGSATHIAVLAVIGEILYFGASTKALQGKIDVGLPASLPMSGDGTVLAAMLNGGGTTFSDDRSVKFFSLPSGAEITTWSYLSAPSDRTPLAIGLSSNGAIVSQDTRQNNAGAVTREVRGISGAPLIYSDTTFFNFGNYPELRTSPDGTLIAASSDLPSGNPSIQIFKNGAQTVTLSGWPVGWIDNNRLLVNMYSSPGRFYGVAVYDASGRVLAEPAMPQLLKMQLFSSDAVYSPGNTIFSLATGESIWSSPNPLADGDCGAVAGDRVVFPSGHTLRIERVQPY
ncbi:MAG: hypothetical protein WDO56_21305 [Gammaproteobacteria bacterium]